MTEFYGYLSQVGFHRMYCIKEKILICFILIFSVCCFCPSAGRLVKSCLLWVQPHSRLCERSFFSQQTFWVNKLSKDKGLTKPNTTYPLMAFLPLARITLGLSEAGGQQEVVRPFTLQHCSSAPTWLHTALECAAGKQSCLTNPLLPCDTSRLLCCLSPLQTACENLNTHFEFFFIFSLSLMSDAD